MINILRKIMAGNRRQHPRVRTALEITLHLPDESQPLITQTRNVSVSGAEILLNRSIPVLSEIDLELLLPDTKENLRIKGKVVRLFVSRTFWDRITNQGIQYIIGISFIDVDMKTRSQIIHTLQEITKVNR